MKRFICSTVLKAGRLARRYRRHLAELAVEAKSEKDLVSEADRAVERFIRSRIEKRFPDHAIAGEEFAPKAGSGKRWQIDPIDGSCFMPKPAAAQRSTENRFTAAERKILRRRC